MKKLIIIFLLLIGFFYCTKQNISSSLEEKEQKLHILRKKSTEIILQIKKLEKEIAEGTQKDPKEYLKKVEAFTLKLDTFEHYIEVQGNVDSEKNIQITPQMSGLILKRYINEGESVVKGQILVEIDAEDIRKNIAEVETNLILASTIYERQKNLWEQNIGSEIQYLQAKAQKESLENALQTLQTQLKKAHVRSPITGTLDEFFFNPGEIASPQFVLARVVNLSKVIVTADVSEKYVRNIRKDIKVLVKFPELGIKKLIPIKQVGKFINPRNRTFKIQMETENKKGWLRLNTLSVIKIKDTSIPNALIIPSNLIQKNTKGESFIYTVVKNEKNDIAQKVIIESGKSYQGKTLITKGLKAGDKVINKGYKEIIDQEVVNLISL